MELINEKEYTDWKGNNEDPYGSAVFRYLENWANLMETQMQKGESLEDIAEQTSHQADTEGMTGFMYGIAVAVLAKCWVHGERLRCWHNLHTQIGTEGERANEEGKVLNPAMINIR